MSSKNSKFEKLFDGIILGIVASIGFYIFFNNLNKEVKST